MWVHYCETLTLVCYRFLLFTLQYFFFQAFLLFSCCIYGGPFTERQLWLSNTKDKTKHKASVSKKDL